MIIVKIIGGLGNQMFQYALGRNLANRNNMELKLDISDFKNYKWHTYGLNKLNIGENIATEKEIAKFKKYKTKSRSFLFFHNKFVADNSIYVHEGTFNFNSKILDIKKSVYLDGYWQSEKYLLGIEDIIREEFTPRSPISPAAKTISEKMGGSSISFHIRRGNYVTDKKVAEALGSCSLDYYQGALLKATMNLNKPEIFAFSDDIGWVKKNIKTKHKITFVSEHKLEDWEEMVLMSKCRRHIISNSTFSWWGAWLDPRKDKMVIAPSMPWFKSQRLANNDIVPSSWIQM
ncbi:MAG: alpha-1,2-fucosyltransferase [Patescibacteria group bacterium]